jgi:hypothetical protein
MFSSEHACKHFGAKGKCANKARWVDHSKSLWCGVHARQRQNTCVALPKRPKVTTKGSAFQQQQMAARVSQLRNHNVTIRERTQINTKEGRVSHLLCAKLLTPVPLIPGYLNILVHVKRSGFRPDGLGCSTLNPKLLGPIYHLQPDLPPAANLSNLHRANHVFPCDLDALGNPTSQFFEKQKALYTAHADAAMKPRVEKPVYVIWQLPSKTWRHLTLVESRQIYCHFYAKLVRPLPEFQKLVQLMQQGVNLQILGVDGYHPIRSLEVHYLDATRPFGVELILYCMLRNTAPWEKYTFLPL